MIIPRSSLNGQILLGQIEWDPFGILQSQRMALTANDDRSDIIKEWENPKVVIATVLMIVGGDIVRSALAQTTGSLFTPVCFSFGWISYSLTALVGIFGDGKLLPPPDHPVKVFNLTTGYRRDNRHWVIGRIVRDHQMLFSKQQPLANNAIRIAIYEAEARESSKARRFPKIHVYCILVMTTQMFIAAIPAVLTGGREWGVFCVTVVGTLLALITGTLPQWSVEKLPNSQESRQIYGLTTGNGSRDIIIIKGGGKCLNLDELAGAESPENGRPWIKIAALSKRISDDSPIRVSKEVLEIPLGLFISRVVLMLLTVCWILLFITLPALDDHTWYLLTVGTIGTVYNAIISGRKRNPKNRNLPLKIVDSIATWRVMDGLMDLEVSHPNCGRFLLTEFFPGDLRADEKDWWDAPPEKRKNTGYDQQRLIDMKNRLTPRSAMPDYESHGDTAGVVRRSGNPHHDITSVAGDAITAPSAASGVSAARTSRAAQQAAPETSAYGAARMPAPRYPALHSGPLEESHRSRSPASILSNETSRPQTRPITISLDGALAPSAQSTNDRASQHSQADLDNLDEITKPPYWE